MKLKLRAAAARDLDTIFDYGATRHGVETATSYLRDLQAGMDRLLDYPELGTDSGIRPDLRSLGVREHRIFYRVEGKAVVIVRVLHKTMDIGRHL